MGIIGEKPKTAVLVGFPDAALTDGSMRSGIVELADIVTYAPILKLK